MNKKDTELILSFIGVDTEPTGMDWNMLMLAVAKIERQAYKKGRHFYLHMEQASVEIRVDRMNIRPFSVWGTSSNSDKYMAVQRAIVEFIQKYETPKNKVLLDNEFCTITEERGRWYRKDKVLGIKVEIIYYLDKNGEIKHISKQ